MAKKFYYYQIEGLGVATSANLLRYDTKKQRMFHCNESLAQYVCVNDIIYRVNWLNKEHPNYKGKYSSVNMKMITQEEYEKLQKSL